MVESRFRLIGGRLPLRQLLGVDLHEVLGNEMCSARLDLGVHDVAGCVVRGLRAQNVFAVTWRLHKSLDRITREGSVCVIAHHYATAQDPVAAASIRPSVGLIVADKFVRDQSQVLAAGADRGRNMAKPILKGFPTRLSGCVRQGVAVCHPAAMGLGHRLKLGRWLEWRKVVNAARPVGLSQHQSRKKPLIYLRCDTSIFTVDWLPKRRTARRRRAEFRMRSCGTQKHQSRSE